jgi:hypothetical protein
MLKLSSDHNGIEVGHDWKKHPHPRQSLAENKPGLKVKQDFLSPAPIFTIFNFDFAGVTIQGVHFLDTAEKYCPGQ